MSKHTPGPWTYRKCGKHFNNSDLERIEINYGSDYECIADTVYEEADARLIAAAPQMLDALEAIIKRFQPEQHDAAGCMFKNCELCKAIAVIKAAKGEA